MPDFFPYRDGELYAEAVPVARIAAAVGTPFYLYSAAALTACYQRLCRGLRAGAPADLLCREGQLQPRRAAGLRRARGRRRRCLGRRVAARARRRHPAATHHLLRCRQDPRRARVRARRRHPPDQRRVGARTAPAQRDRDGKRQDRSGGDPRQSGCRRAAPTPRSRPAARKTNSASPSGDAVAAYRLAADLPGIEPVGLAVHIGSQIATSPRAARPSRGLPSWSRELRGLGLAVRQLDLGGGLDDPLPRRGSRTSPAAYAGAGARGVRPARRGLGLRARPLPGRLGRIARRQRHLRQGRREPHRRPRRGDERSDPPGVIRGMARDRAGATAGQGRVDDAGRRGRADLRDHRHLCRAVATSRRWPRAIWSPSRPPGPMAR